MILTQGSLNVLKSGSLPVPPNLGFQILLFRKFCVKPPTSYRDRAPSHGPSALVPLPLPTTS